MGHTTTREGRMRRKRVRDEGYTGSAGERRTMWWVRSSPMDTLRLKAVWRWQAASVFSSSAFIKCGITCYGSWFPRLPGVSICAGALVSIRQSVEKCSSGLLSFPPPLSMFRCHFICICIYYLFVKVFPQFLNIYFMYLISLY